MGKEKSAVDLLITCELQLQIVFAERVPHGPQLTNQLRIHVLSGHRGILKPFAYIRRLAVEIVKIVKIRILFDQRMAPYLLEGDAPVGVDLQHSPDQVLGLWAEVIWHLILSLLRLRHHNAYVRIIKWKSRSEHGKKDDTHTPKVGFVAPILSVLEEFGCCVMGTTTCCIEPMSVGLVESSHSKISNFDFEVSTDQYVLRLEVSVADVEGMAVGDGADDLSKKVDGDFLTKATLHIDKGEQIALINIFEYQVTILSAHIGEETGSAVPTLLSGSPKYHISS